MPRCTVPENHRGLRGWDAPDGCEVCSEVRAEADAAMHGRPGLGDTLHPAIPGRRMKGVASHEDPPGYNVRYENIEPAAVTPDEMLETERAGVPNEHTDSYKSQLQYWRDWYASQGISK